jgi:hypothetical protein
MNNPEKQAGAIKNEQSRETGNIGHKTQNEDQKTKKHNIEN